jgi:hypothetical protein
MKPIFLLLLLFTSLVRADEIGSQYKEQAEAGDARASIIWPIHTLAPVTASRRAVGRESRKGGDVDAMGLLSQILFTQEIMRKLRHWRSRQPSRAANAARSCWRACW